MNNIFWAAINLAPGIGSKTLRQLYGYFHDGERVWSATVEELKRSNCLKEKALSELIEIRQKISIEKLKCEFIEKGINICVEIDEIYPKLLKQIYDPPFILYYKGTLPTNDKCIAIVGSRRATVYGKQIAHDMAKQLSGKGFIVVSGAAKGIDTSAHEGALMKGKTIAVLGCGLDVIYPAENKSLLEKIAENGAVISEFPLGTAPLAGNFPARNRIITGLSKGVLVVEAARKSGSLITAEFALDEGRDVFAIPGNIYSKNSEGCHYLIRQGAKLVCSADDITEEYMSENKDTVLSEKLFEAEEKLKFLLTNEEKLIYDNLSFTEPTCIDEIIYKLRMNVSNISFILLQMKLKGLVTETSPNFYIRAIRECFE